MNKTQRLKEIASELDRLADFDVPRPSEIKRILLRMLSLLFYEFERLPEDEGKSTEKLLWEISDDLTEVMSRAFRLAKREEPELSSVTLDILSRLPAIREVLSTDIRALYDGDPAATSYEEIALAYPGFLAIAVYRIAHEFYIRNIPLIPRMMTEYAHERTGIDIHAGAVIGESFFIDHGTGIVIGETCVIGNRVKLYQGVTLGAKSFELDEHGNPAKGKKRHPNIEDGVVIYANATILGGRTTIGEGAVIGANTWITHSVAPGVVVCYNEK